jgi:hypothetical protein
MVLGCLGGIEAALRAQGVACGRGGLELATAALAET